MRTEAAIEQCGRHCRAANGRDSTSNGEHVAAGASGSDEDVVYLRPEIGTQLLRRFRVRRSASTTVDVISGRLVGALITNALPSSHGGRTMNAAPDKTK